MKELRVFRSNPQNKEVKLQLDYWSLKGFTASHIGAATPSSKPTWIFCIFSFAPFLPLIWIWKPAENNQKENFIALITVVWNSSPAASGLFSLSCSCFHLVLSSNVDSDGGGGLFPRSPQQAPFAPTRAVLTEKTHLPCIVKNFINSNLCHSGLCTGRETLGPCTNLSLKLSKKFVLMQYG